MARISSLPVPAISRHVGLGLGGCHRPDTPLILSAEARIPGHEGKDTSLRSHCGSPSASWPWSFWSAALKLLAAAGLTLPTTLGISAWLAPLSALGLMMYMTGATAVRVVRREWGYALGDLTFIALSGFAAWGWAFGPGAQLSC
ncbi:DoxX family protein [Nesterenkonia aethiopica]|uniref:DoxX family protein n=1 Tax=Nesterenkonia aethiopica TaxID=269144 RepID=UPI0031DEC5C5